LKGAPPQFDHRGLRCLVVIELKLGRFTAAYKGQMEHIGAENARILDVSG
jgi:hypothetical protein